MGTLYPPEHGWPYSGLQGLGDYQRGNPYANGYGGGGGGADNQTPTHQEKTNVANNTDEAIPDVSLTRVLKWAIVLMIAMALGERFWKQFGPRIADNLHKVLGGPLPPPAP